MVVHLHRPPHRVRIAVKLALPVRIAQHDIRHAVVAVLVARIEEPSQVGLHFRRLEVVPAHQVRPGRRRRRPARTHAHRALDRVGRQRHERPVAVAQVQVVGIRLRRRRLTVLPHPLHHVQARRLRHVQRMQNQRIQHAEHDRIGADPQRQRHHRRQRKPRRLAQLPHRKSDVVVHVHAPATEIRNTRFLQSSLQSAQPRSKGLMRAAPHSVVQKRRPLSGIGHLPPLPPDAGYPRCRVPHLGAGCPTLAASLFLRLGWGWPAAQAGSPGPRMWLQHRRWVPQVSLLRPGMAG